MPIFGDVGCVENFNVHRSIRVRFLLVARCAPAVRYQFPFCTKPGLRNFCSSRYDFDLTLSLALTLTLILTLIFTLILTFSIDFSTSNY